MCQNNPNHLRLRRPRQSPIPAQEKHTNQIEKLDSSADLPVLCRLSDKNLLHFAIFLVYRNIPTVIVKF